MKTIAEFLDLYSKPTTKQVYRGSIHAFLEFIYGKKRVGRRATKSEIAEFEHLAKQYFSENRDYADDLLRFAASLNSKPPKTAKTYMGGVKEYLGYNDIELTQRQLKTIRLKLPKGNARTIEKDMDSITIRKILQHTDIKGRALIFTLASSGMRIGEALSITIDDIDLTVKPATITIRGEYTKTGEQRLTYIHREAVEALNEWLRVRERYIKASVNKNKGLVSSGIGSAKDENDNRVFPFSLSVAEQVWSHAIKNAGLLSIDKGTKRKQLRIHQLRKFFRSQLALGCPVDIVETLMGHEGYLTDAYRRYPKAQMAEQYLKHEYLLYIQMPQDLQKIESEFKDELNNNRKLVESLVVKNLDLEKQMVDVKNTADKRIDELKKSMDIMRAMVFAVAKGHGSIIAIDDEQAVKELELLYKQVEPLLKQKNSQ
jgi:integrase